VGQQIILAAIVQRATVSAEWLLNCVEPRVRSLERARPLHELLTSKTAKVVLRPSLRILSFPKWKPTPAYCLEYRLEQVK
jgi:hypothetical protein